MMSLFDEEYLASAIMFSQLINKDNASLLKIDISTAQRIISDRFQSYVNSNSQMINNGMQKDRDALFGFKDMV